MVVGLRLRCPWLWVREDLPRVTGEDVRTLSPLVARERICRQCRTPSVDRLHQWDSPGPRRLQ